MSDARTRRRRFLKAVPAAVAGSLAVPALARQEQAAANPKETLECGEKIFGVDFSDAEEEQALVGVNRNLDTYEHCARSMSRWIPSRRSRSARRCQARQPKGARRRTRSSRSPCRRRGAGRRRSTSSRSCRSRRSRRSSSGATSASTELTRMYLDRLKKHGPTLNCVVTLTEDLALAQAAEADKEIRAGQIQGPAARDSVGRQGSVRDQRHPDDLGRGAVPEPGVRLRRDDRSSDCAMPARCSSRSCRWARWRRATAGSAAGPRIHGTRTIRQRAGRAARRPDRARPRPPGSSASRSAPKRAARSSRRRPSTASSDCARPTAASAATARWR